MGLGALAAQELHHDRLGLPVDLEPVVIGAGGDPGVVDEDVERAELALDRREHRPHLRAVGDVRLDGSPAGRPLQCRHGLFGCLEPDLVHDDVRALVGKEHRDRAAEARAASRHQRDLVLELHPSSSIMPPATHPRPKGPHGQAGRAKRRDSQPCVRGTRYSRRPRPQAAMPSYSLGIDIGGTFTDVVVYDHDTGRQWSRKVLTTHDDPVRAVVAGVAAILADGRLEPRHFTRVVHATTLFTNAPIERKGARAGLVTTAGFGDTLEIGRERKFELYDLNIAKPEPLVPRDLRLEVTERTGADGRIRRPLDRGELAAAVDRLAAAGVSSIAVTFLHAYANPSHEAEAVRVIAERHPEI